MNKLIIFDVDGTVLDTINTITLHANGAMRDFGLKEYTNRQLEQILGYSSKYLIENMLKMQDFAYDEEKLEEILNHYHKLYQADVTNLTTPFEGIIELLVSLRQKGYLLAALSNKPEHTLSIVFNELDFGRYFDFSMGQVDEIPKKPNPHMVYEIMGRFGLEKEQVCLVGDTEVDFETAKNAGIKFVAVTWGFRSREQLSGLNPEYIIDKAEELNELLDGGLLI